MRLATVLLAAALSSGCAELRDLFSFQQGLAKEFSHAAIGVNINNADLTVTFANAPADSLPEADRAAYARRVAEYVRDHYTHYSSLQRISVGFSTIKKTGPVTFTNTSVPYHYTPADLGPPKVSPEKTVSS